MQHFSLMGKAVDELCKSMEETPHRWEISSLTLLDKNSKIKYWIAYSGDPITEIWNGCSREKVFSESQGLKFRDAMEALAERNGTMAQKKILQSVEEKTYKIVTNPEPCLEKNPWWKFWE